VTRSLNAAGVSLRELLGRELHGTAAPDVRVTSCTSDRRQVRPGDVFVALVDSDEDGHDGAAEAARRGAAAIVCERILPVFDMPQCIVPCSRAAYGRLCQALVGDPSQRLKVISVTGTHGKTTVARLLDAILRQAGAAVGTFDSFGYWDGWEDRSAVERLTPPALARALAQMAAAGASHAVLEISSQELCEQVLSGVTVDAACVTNVFRKRLDWHGSVENYRQAERRVLNHLHSDGVAIFNADDPVSMRMLCDVSQPALTFGLKKPAEITAEIIEQHVNEQVFLLSAGEESACVRTAIVGDHHVYNCLAAATTALAYGVELVAIARGLESVDYLPGRMECVACGQGFAVLIDAANSSESLRACLRAARRVTSGRLICVFGADADSDASDWLAMGRVVGALANSAVVTSNELHPLASGPSLQLVRGFADRRKARIIKNRAEAVAWAFAEAQAGDTVVIAGMGERVVGVSEPDDMPLTDSHLARRLLNDIAGPVSQSRIAA
jgi:UDP-N-acetylmuramoyl-L-alanyl-D-glutamate--2,6-diaminopimelate ligase